MSKSGVIALAAVMALSAAAPAVAQSEYRQQLQSQFDNARNLVSSDGYTVAIGPFIGMLNNGNRERFTIPVQKGVSYKVLGVCDNDCSDVDIKLFNMSGTNIGEDVLADDVPIVELIPTADGQVQIEVIMATCSQNPCYHGVEVYWKR